MSKKFLAVVNGDTALEGLVQSLRAHCERVDERKIFIKKMIKDFEAEQEEHHKSWWNDLEECLIKKELVTKEQRRNMVLSLSENLDVIFSENKEDFLERDSNPFAKFMEHLFN